MGFTQFMPLWSHQLGKCKIPYQQNSKQGWCTTSHRGSGCQCRIPYPSPTKLSVCDKGTGVAMGSSTALSIFFFYHPPSSPFPQWHSMPPSRELRLKLGTDEQLHAWRGEIQGFSEMQKGKRQLRCGCLHWYVILLSIETVAKGQAFISAPDTASHRYGKESGKWLVIWNQCFPFLDDILKYLSPGKKMRQFSWSLRRPQMDLIE